MQPEESILAEHTRYVSTDIRRISCHFEDFRWFIVPTDLALESFRTGEINNVGDYRFFAICIEEWPS